MFYCYNINALAETGMNHYRLPQCVQTKMTLFKEIMTTNDG